MEINLKTGAYSYRKNDGAIVQRPAGFNGGVLADWLGTSGVDASDQRVRNLCDSAYLAIAEISDGAAEAGTFTPFRDSIGLQTGIAHPAFVWTVPDGPHPALIAMVALFWLMVWIYGMRRIARRYGRRGTAGDPAPE